MLPKTAKAIVTSDYWPIANVCVLGRIEHTLDSARLEEQHGFCKNRRMEEYLVDKKVLMDTPIWFNSLDLSKAFDRVDWQALWTALATHGVSQHLILLVQLLYNKQRGQVLAYTAENREFEYYHQVRQGCVLRQGWHQVVVRTVCSATLGFSTFYFFLGKERWAKHLCNGSLTAAHGVVGQPTSPLTAHCPRKLLQMERPSTLDWSQEIAKAGWQCCLISFIL